MTLEHTKKDLKNLETGEKVKQENFVAYCNTNMWLRGMQKGTRRPQGNPKM